MSKAQSKSKSETVEPVVDIPRGTIVLPWSVKGRGKSATYCAAVPAGSKGIGQGTRCALVAKSGAVTFATLTEPRETVEGLTRWDFERDTERMTPEVRRANRAAKSAQSAAYWQSDAGLKTAERIAQRTAAKSETSDAESEPATSEPATSEPATVETSETSDAASMAAAMRAAGFSAAEVLAALQSAQSEPAKSEPAKSAQSKSPRKSKSKSEPAAKSEPAGLSRCDACNRDRRGVAQHSGAPELETCPRCSTLDADTARMRADRHN